MDLPHACPRCLRSCGEWSAVRLTHVDKHKLPGKRKEAPASQPDQPGPSLSCVYAGCDLAGRFARAPRAGAEASAIAPRDGEWNGKKPLGPADDVRRKPRAG